jgi:hypothetical protein
MSLELPYDDSKRLNAKTWTLVAEPRLGIHTKEARSATHLFDYGHKIAKNTGHTCQFYVGQAKIIFVYSVTEMFPVWSSRASSLFWLLSSAHLLANWRTQGLTSIKKSIRSKVTPQMINQLIYWVTNKLHQYTEKFNHRRCTFTLVEILVWIYKMMSE